MKIKRKLIYFISILLLSFTVNIIHKNVFADATITVNSTADTDADDGTCTLREAIDSANNDIASGATPGECIAGDGADTIVFAISGSGVKTIALLSALPDITTPMTINGYSQTGAAVNTNPAPQGVNTVLTVELDGSSCVGSCDMEIVGTSDVTVRGLSIHSYADSNRGAISVSTSSNVTIEGNYVGVTPSGSAAGNFLEGIDIRNGSTNIRIGGSSASQRNVVSNNATGNAGADNILVNDGGTNTTSNITIAGNIVGLNPSGTTAFTNPSSGIRLKNGVKNATVGGATQASANLVAGYTSMGILVSQESDTSPEENTNITIRNNYVGYASDLSTNLMGPTTNGGIGLATIDPTILAGADISGVDITNNNVIGTGLSGAGISVVNASPNTTYSDIVIHSNDLNGDNVANLTGIAVGANVSDVQVGSTNPSQANTIYNYEVGIRMLGIGPASPQATLFGNNVFDNGNHGIDICEDTDFNFICDTEVGPTANDANDTDSGPNGYMNTPVLNSADQVGDELTVNFDLDAADSPSNQYRVDLYYSDTADGSGFGEGQVYLGGATSVNGAGNEITFNIDNSIDISQGVLTATTTAIDGTTTSGYGATSEFSAVLSDNITFEPAPEEPSGNNQSQNNANNNNTATTGSSNLSKTGQTSMLIGLIAFAGLIISTLAITYFKRKS